MSGLSTIDPSRTAGWVVTGCAGPPTHADHTYFVTDRTTHTRIRKTTIASVICTHSPMFPSVASIRSFQGYGRRPHPVSMTDVVARFHHMSSSGTYTQP